MKRSLFVVLRKDAGKAWTLEAGADSLAQAKSHIEGVKILDAVFNRPSEYKIIQKYRA